MTLAPCPRCRRHVREPACPLCDATLAVTIADGADETVEIAVEPVPPVRDNACCMPYGAPQRRTRVV